MKTGQTKERRQCRRQKEMQKKEMQKRINAEGWQKYRRNEG